MTPVKLRIYFKAAGLCVLLLFASCRDSTRKYVLSERKFTAFLVDLHLAEAVGSQSKRTIDLEYEVDSASLYGSVFQKYNVTQAMFDSTLYFYSQRPEKFQKIYNTVATRLNLMEQELIREEKEQELTKSEILWQSDSVYVFTKGGDKVDISVRLRGPGIYSVSATVKILPDDASLDPRMSIYFWRKDTTEEGEQMRFLDVRYTLRNGVEKSYRAVRRIDSTNYSFLRGYIANYSNDDSVFRRNMVIRDIVVSKQKIPEK